MKNKIILVVIGIVLLLLLASSGYGSKIGPPQRIKDSPWQEDVPCQSPGMNGLTPDINFVSVNNPANVAAVIPIRFGNIDLFFIKQKSESSSDKKVHNLLR